MPFPFIGRTEALLALRYPPKRKPALGELSLALSHESSGGWLLKYVLDAKSPGINVISRTTARTIFIGVEAVSVQLG